MIEKGITTDSLFFITSDRHELHHTNYSLPSQSGSSLHCLKGNPELTKRKLSKFSLIWPKSSKTSLPSLTSTRISVSRPKSSKTSPLISSKSSKTSHSQTHFTKTSLRLPKFSKTSLTLPKFFKTSPNRSELSKTSLKSSKSHKSSVSGIQSLKASFTPSKSFKTSLSRSYYFKTSRSLSKSSKISLIRTQSSKTSLTFPKSSRTSLNRTQSSKTSVNQTQSFLTLVSRTQSFKTSVNRTQPPKISVSQTQPSKTSLSWSRSPDTPLTSLKSAKTSEHRNQSVFISTSRWCFKRYVLSCAVLLFSILTQVSVTISSTVSPLHSPPPSLKLSLAILVAESCDETFITKIGPRVDQAITDFKDFVQATEYSINSTPLEVGYSIHPFCSTRSVVAALDEILGNSTTNVVLSLSTYDVHSSFLPLAEIYRMAYIAVNTFTLKLARTQSVSFAPQFSQSGLMLAKVLDMYRWQDVHIIYTSFNFWQDFATYLYFELTLLNFQVHMGDVLDSHVTPELASLALGGVKNSKVVVLLMDTEDQLSVLAMASMMSLTLHHAFFAFANSPYDSGNDSIIGVKPAILLEDMYFNDSQAEGVNIFESLFVIDVSFPVEQIINSSLPKTTRRKRCCSSSLRIRPRVSPRQLSSGTVEDADALLTEKNARHSLKVISDLDTTNDRLTPHRQSDLHFVFVNRDKAINDVNSFIHELGDSVNSLTYKIQDVVETEFVNGISSSNTGKILYDQQVGLATTQVYKSHYKDNLPYSQSRRRTEVDGVVGREIQQPITEHSQHLFNFDIFDTSSRSPQHGHTRDIESQSRQNQVLKFESEDMKSQPKFNLLNNLFTHSKSEVLSSFRAKRAIEKFMATDADLDALYDIVFLVAYATSRFANNKNYIPYSDGLITSLANITFPGSSGQFQVDSEQKVSYDFWLYDFNVASGTMVPGIIFKAVSSEDWIMDVVHQVSWPGSVELSPDECYKQVPGCNEGFQGSVIAAIVISSIVLVAVVILAVTFVRY